MDLTLCCTYNETMLLQSEDEFIMWVVVQFHSPPCGFISLAPNAIRRRFPNHLKDPMRFFVLFSKHVTTTCRLSLQQNLCKSQY